MVYGDIWLIFQFHWERWYAKLGKALILLEIGRIKKDENYGSGF